MSSCVSAVLIGLACDEHLSPRQLKHKHSLHNITLTEYHSNHYLKENNWASRGWEMFVTLSMCGSHLYVKLLAAGQIATN